MSVRIRAGVCAALGLAALCGGDAPVWAFGFSIEPARVEVSVPAGKRRGKTLTVKNARTDQPVHLNMYIRDVRYQPDGTNDFPDPGTTPWSAASWVQVTPMELDIPPQSSRDVRISVTAPPDAAGGHYAVVFFESLPTLQEDGISVNFRIGAVVEAVVPGTEQRAMRLTNLVLEAPATLQASLFNDGNFLVRPKGTVKIFDAAGRRVHQEPFNRSGVGVLPNSARTVSHQLEAEIPPGRYRITAEIDYGTRSLLVGELPVNVP
jgi:hypothetical protein